DLANLADEAANSLLDSLNEWQFHLQDESSLQPTDDGHESIWLWENGEIPEELTTLVGNCHVAASSLLKHVYGLRDALSAARRDKDQDSAQIDRAATDFGIFVAQCEEIADLWELMSTTRASEQDEPLAKWISQRHDNNRTDWSFHASPISSAAHLANHFWRKAAG
ncbi:ATP-dependent DNA helicase DinG, partial [Kingella kingae]|nr:ATP-dependent DNA helicase DinG [Kingella kingae]